MKRYRVEFNNVSDIVHSVEQPIVSLIQCLWPLTQNICFQHIVWNVGDGREIYLRQNKGYKYDFTLIVR